jgi:prepilin-type N-terminal cleavage/methylation domain-containing protein
MERIGRPFATYQLNEFTLIELLIVNAIIAIIAAILFPAIATAMDMARQSRCEATCGRSALPR